MNKDIVDRHEIETVMNEFYKRINDDESLSFFFTKIIKINWEIHIAHMCDFWENVLFHVGEYDGNPLETHRRINSIHQTTDEHFKTWLSLFYETIDLMYQGPNADKMKNYATSIASVMQQKM